MLAGAERVEVAPGDTTVTPLRFASYLRSASLVMALVWGLAFAGIMRLRGASVRAAAVVAALVVSHWVLDVVSHRPDMPVWPGSGPLVGLGLWRSAPATYAVELGLYAAGVIIYARTTRARDRTGTWAFVGLVGFLLVSYFGNAFGPPPPSPTAVAVVSLALWLIPLWGWWIERHRALRGRDGVAPESARP